MKVIELIQKLAEYPENWQVKLDLDPNSLPDECRHEGCVVPNYYDVTGIHVFDEGEVSIEIDW